MLPIDVKTSYLAGTGSWTLPTTREQRRSYERSNFYLGRVIVWTSEQVQQETLFLIPHSADPGMVAMIPSAHLDCSRNQSVNRWNLNELSSPIFAHAATVAYLLEIEVYNSINPEDNTGL